MTGIPEIPSTLRPKVFCEVILCLDLGTKTGWALRNQYGYIHSDTIDFSNRRFEGGGMRYIRFEGFLNAMRLDYSLSKLYFEEVRAHRGVDASHSYGGFMACLTKWCEAFEIPYDAVPVGTIKKFITGKGNANKTAVIEAVKKLGHNVKDDNEADALALLHYALNLRKN